jgi:uncharacterized protein (TIGR03067 family)
MTRFALACGLLLASGFTSAQEKKDPKTDTPHPLSPFQGSWKVVKADFGGKAPVGSNRPEMRFTFNGDKVSVKEGKADAETGSYSVNIEKNPPELDLVSSRGTKILGIYSFEKDGKLRLCFVSDGGTRPKSFDTTNTMSGLIVLEKVKE